VVNVSAPIDGSWPGCHGDHQAHALRLHGRRGSPEIHGVFGIRGKHDMASFNVKEYTLPGQHIREFARGTANAQDEVLQVAVKEYVPKDNPEPKEGDVTIIGAHANGFPKVRRASFHLVVRRTRARIILGLRSRSTSGSRQEGRRSCYSG